MRCEDFLPLIEKLSDGEATAAEKLQAEAHLERCEACRTHFRFLNALPEAARQTSPPEPPEIYWQVLPRKIMSRIGGKQAAAAPRSWLSRMLRPSRLRWAGALAAALVAAVVGLQVLDFPFADREVSSPRPAPRSNEEESNLAISGEDAPTSTKDSLVGEVPASSPDSVADAFQEEALALQDENLEQAARKRAAPQPALPSAPKSAQEGFVGGALSRDARQEKPDGAGERADREEPAAAGRVEKDLDEKRMPDEERQYEAKRRSVVPLRTAQTDQTESQRVPEAPAPAEMDAAAQPLSLTRSLEAEAEPGKSESSAEESYRALRERYPLPTSQPGYKIAANRAKGKESKLSVSELEAECAAWREFVERYSDGTQGREARYRLARCSIGVFDLLASEENRKRALEDGASYLEVAPEGERAEEIRQALERIGR